MDAACALSYSYIEVKVPVCLASVYAHHAWPRLKSCKSVEKGLAHEISSAKYKHFRFLCHGKCIIRTNNIKIIGNAKPVKLHMAL